MYLLVPATRLGDMSRWLLRVVRSEERRNVDISEEVAQPGAYWQVIDGLCSSLLTIGSGQYSIRTTDWAACPVAVLVVRQLCMFAVNVSHVVVWAGFYLAHASLADFLEELLGQGPRARVVVGRHEQQQEVINRFC